VTVPSPDRPDSSDGRSPDDRNADDHGPDAPLRVLLVAQQLNRKVPGGIGTMIRGLVRGLAEIESGPYPGIGTELTLYASRRKGPVDSLVVPGRRVLHSMLPGPLLTRAWDRRLLKAPRGFDVVQATSLHAPFPRDAREAVTVHDLTWRTVPQAFGARSRRWHEQALQRVLARAAVIVTPSDSVAAELEAAGAPASRLRAIPLGSDHLPDPDRDGARDLIARLGVEGEFLLTVGTLEPRKNLVRLFEAYTSASSRLEGRRLLVVGPEGWGPSLPQVEGVVLSGHVPDAVLAALYELAKLFVYIPLVEGFGIPPLEAMRLGTPVVASPVPSVCSVGLQVDPRDVGQIAEALVGATHDEQLRRRLVAEGAAHASRYSWARCATGYLELWETLR